MNNMSNCCVIGCHTPIGSESWDRHLAELHHLKTKAEKLDLPGLALELSLLILSHLDAKWQAEDGEEK